MNTAVSQMMIFVNEFTKSDVKPKKAMESFVRILSPFAPHICEELWRILGNSKSIYFEEFPTVDESKLQLDTVEIILQVNSKIKANYG